jgi:hypothetical protein
LRHEGRHSHTASAQALARHPEIAAVHTNPQALAKKIYACRVFVIVDEPLFGII